VPPPVARPAAASRPPAERRQAAPARRAASAPATATGPGQPARPAPAQRPAARARVRNLGTPATRRAARVAGAGHRQSGRATETIQAGLAQGGQHALAAELLLFVAIVGVRAVAQYGPADKSNLPEGQFGPLFILGNGFAAFFVLAFLAARGGTAARLAAIGGLAIDIALLLNSIQHIEAVAAVTEKPRKYVPAAETATTPAEAAVMPPGLALEVKTGKLPPTPKGKSPRAAMAYARKSLKDFGWATTQFAPLLKLWNQESGWNYKAVNPNSGAIGIPQLLPSAHQIPAGYRTSIVVQIKWGLEYIKATYGSPAAAWAHEQHFNWY
jgi:hypothetical protein